MNSVIMWNSLAPTMHTLLCNPAGPGQFCALPSQCLALWQCQQLNMSVCHASSVVNMLGAQVCPATVESVSACFHGIEHTPTPSPTGSVF